MIIGNHVHRPLGKKVTVLASNGHDHDSAMSPSMIRIEVARSIEVLDSATFDQDTFLCWITGVEECERIDSAQYMAILMDAGFLSTRLKSPPMASNEVAIFYSKHRVQGIQ